MFGFGKKKISFTFNFTLNDKLISISGEEGGVIDQFQKYYYEYPKNDVDDFLLQAKRHNSQAGFFDKITIRPELKERYKKIDKPNPVISSSYPTPYNSENELLSKIGESIINQKNIKIFKKILTKAEKKLLEKDGNQKKIIDIFEEGSFVAKFGFPWQGQLIDAQTNLMHFKDLLSKAIKDFEKNQSQASQHQPAPTKLNLQDEIKKQRAIKDRQFNSLMTYYAEQKSQRCFNHNPFNAFIVNQGNCPNHRISDLISKLRETVAGREYLLSLQEEKIRKNENRGFLKRFASFFSLSQKNYIPFETNDGGVSVYKVDKKIYDKFLNKMTSNINFTFLLEDEMENKKASDKISKLMNNDKLFIYFHNCKPQKVDGGMLVTVSLPQDVGGALLDNPKDDINKREVRISDQQFEQLRKKYLDLPIKPDLGLLFSKTKAEVRQDKIDKYAKETTEKINEALGGKKSRYIKNLDDLYKEYTKIHNILQGYFRFDQTLTYDPAGGYKISFDRGNGIKYDVSLTQDQYFDIKSAFEYCQDDASGLFPLAPKQYGRGGFSSHHFSAYSKSTGYNRGIGAGSYGKSGGGRSR